LVLHDGKISEMRTGEGKERWSRTLPAYLNALSARGVHIVTVNDTSRAETRNGWGRSTVSRAVGGGDPDPDAAREKQSAYAPTSPYGTNNEFGFDYLRDNMAMRWATASSAKLNYAIVDEVDPILIDEARTAGSSFPAGRGSHGDLQRLNAVAPLLKRRKRRRPWATSYCDEKNHTVLLSEEGHESAEKLLAEQALARGPQPLRAGVREPDHHLNAALRRITFSSATALRGSGREADHRREFTGRLMPDGAGQTDLHQAIEAKENVSIQSENQTLASITFQKTLPHVPQACRMTGTADTEAYEFQEITGWRWSMVPTHMPMIRADRKRSGFFAPPPKSTSDHRRHQGLL